MAIRDGYDGYAFYPLYVQDMATIYMVDISMEAGLRRKDVKRPSRSEWSDGKYGFQMQMGHNRMKVI